MSGENDRDLTSSAGSSGRVQFTIRCAMQTFTDMPVDCPLDWTVVQLKNHLSEVCPSKPEVSRQRLIYSGHIMENGDTLRHILRQREQNALLPVEKQVIHLVYISKENVLKGEGVRYRVSSTNNNRPQSSSTTISSPVNSTSQPQVQAAQISSLPFAFPTAPAFQWPHHGQQTAGQPPMSHQSYYQAYTLAYQNYMNQMSTAMMQLYQQRASATQPLPEHNQFLAGQFGHAGWYQQQPMMMNFANGQQMAFGPQPGPIQIAAVQNAAPAPAVGQDAPAMGGAGLLGGAMGEDEEGGGQRQPDFLDLIYKFIRFALLMMLLYLYSSWERFLCVFVAIGFIWFVQARRRQNIRRLNEAAAAQQRVVPQQREPANPERPDGEGVPNDANNNNPELTPERIAGAQRPAAGTGVNAWQIFWSTVSAFFTSLIPEQPGVPLNVN